MVIILIPQGGLGNIIFQYQAMVSQCSSAKWFVMPETDLNNVFELDSRCLKLKVPRRWRARFIGYWGRFFGWLANLGVLSLIEPEVITLEDGYESELSKLRFRSGWFRATVIRGYFQTRDYAVPKPKLRPQYLELARAQMLGLAMDNCVAVHLRFGDYRNWSVLGRRGAALPSSFYKVAMQQILECISNPIFIVFSDDIESAKSMLGNASNLRYYSGLSAAEDLAAMSLCGHAIISASTFAWWGAVLINNAQKIVIAPCFWLGFKSRRWFPLTMQDPELTFIGVPEYSGGG